MILYICTVPAVPFLLSIEASVKSVEDFIHIGFGASSRLLLAMLLVPPRKFQAG